MKIYRINYKRVQHFIYDIDSHILKHIRKLERVTGAIQPRVGHQRHIHALQRWREHVVARVELLMEQHSVQINFVLLHVIFDVCETVLREQAFLRGSHMRTWVVPIGSDFQFSITFVQPERYEPLSSATLLSTLMTDLLALWRTCLPIYPPVLMLTRFTISTFVLKPVLSESLLAFDAVLS